MTEQLMRYGQSSCSLLIIFLLCLFHQFSIHCFNHNKSDAENVSKVNRWRLSARVRHTLQTAMSIFRIRQVHMPHIVTGQKHHEPGLKAEKRLVENNQRARVQRRSAICWSVVEFRCSSSKLILLLFIWNLESSGPVIVINIFWQTKAHLSQMQQLQRHRFVSRLFRQIRPKQQEQTVNMKEKKKKSILFKIWKTLFYENQNVKT